ncbi:MAG: hypothetical protein IKL59_02235 [Clostridia bacterium]|nr:hypothetical protein [Clostridia bacterium]
MKKLIILLLALTLILGVFASCNKRYLQIDEETSSSSSETITAISTNTVEETSKETTEETTLDSTEESVETAKYKETINITETMETIKTDNGVVGDIDIGYRPLIEYDYTIQKVGDQYYMVLNDYTPSGEVPYGSTGYSYISSPLTYSGMSALDMLKYGIPNGQMGYMSDSYIGHLLYFKSQEDNVGVKLYDVEHVWRPKTLPYSWELRKITSDEASDIAVAWSGETYRFHAEKSGSKPMSTSMWIEILTESRFLNDISECEELSIDKKTFSNESKTATVITTTSQEYIFITNGKYFVKIEYYGADISEQDYLTFEFEEY